MVSTGLFENLNIAYKLDFISALRDLWCSSSYSCLSLINDTTLVKPFMFQHLWAFIYQTKDNDIYILSVINIKNYIYVYV